MSGRQVGKTYLALVVGDAPSFTQKQGMIETKLECKNGWVRIPGVQDVYERDQSTIPSSRRRGEHWTRDAVTEYEVLATSVSSPWPSAWTSQSPVPLSLLLLSTSPHSRRCLSRCSASACTPGPSINFALTSRKPFAVSGRSNAARAVVCVAHPYLTDLTVVPVVTAPILGDALYLNPRSPQLRAIKAAVDLPRSLFLHSSQLSLHVRPRPSCPSSRRRCVARALRVAVCAFVC